MRVAEISVFLLLAVGSFQYIVDLSQSNMYSNSNTLNTYCSKDMELDFSFSSQSMLYCDTNAWSISNPQASTLYFLDTNRAYLNLMLVNA